MQWDAKRWPSFTEAEFKCKHTGKCNMRPDFLDILQSIRKAYNRPMIVTSGFRDPSHPEEAKKPQPGEHSLGLAADIEVSGVDAMELFMIAYSLGVRRIGVSGKPGARFLHLGWADKYISTFPPALWSY